jgi:hypothetical protein
MPMTSSERSPVMNYLDTLGSWLAGFSYFFSLS